MHTASNAAPAQVGFDPAPLLPIIFESLALHQAVFGVAELGVADALGAGAKSTRDLATELQLDEDSLYRVLRLLASQAIFQETAPRVFANTAASNCLRSDAPVSFRAMARFRGTDFVYRSFREILHTLRTGEAGRLRALGMDGWEYMQAHPEVARIFDDAMTNLSSSVAPAIAAAYDFGRWQSLMDVAGGNGILLAGILRAHPALRGVLSDQEHVLQRARERGFLSGDLQARTSMQPCDLFHNIPAGCRAYLMKSVIHDWSDDEALRILTTCRKAVPNDGALLLVEQDLPEDSSPSRANFIDVTMMMLTGGKERTVAQYGSLLAKAKFRLTTATKTPTGFNVIEARPV
jgi:hypothetical protein